MWIDMLGMLVIEDIKAQMVERSRFDATPRPSVAPNQARKHRAYVLALVMLCFALKEQHVGNA